VWCIRSWKRRKENICGQRFFYNLTSIHIFHDGKKQAQLCIYITLRWIIQGYSEGICNTLGNDSMGDSKQKSSYEHGSDFEQLRNYDRLKLRIEGNDY